MFENQCYQFMYQFCEKNHLAVAIDARKSFWNVCRVLFEKRKIPIDGWSDNVIEQFIQFLSSLDSNNFVYKCGVGEREARIVCQLVAKRHYGFCHGIGRSGDLEESQPKAVGSTILNKLTNSLCLDLIQTMGVRSTSKAILVPMATGMTLTICLLTLAKNRPSAKYVLWSRIDQKSCFKSILLAGFIPIVINCIPSDNGLITDTVEFKSHINTLRADQIVCIFSTTSCFAPRQCDNILELAKLAKDFEIPHLINNAYGLQARFYANKIENANRHGRVDLFVQSTDKNIMVPVGGAIVAGFSKESVQNVARKYAGRASSSSSLDVCMTLLSLGKTGYQALVKDREDNYLHLTTLLKNLEIKYDFRTINLKNNPISIAFPLDNFDQSKTIEIGSMLFKRNVSGARVITCTDTKTIGAYRFNGWGCHSTSFTRSYLTVASSIGISPKEINAFVRKLDKILEKMTNY